MNEPVASNENSTGARRTIWLLPAIVGLSLFLNCWGNSFPLGYHYDEPKKVLFVREYIQDFHHPVLMLELVRSANGIFQFEDELAIAQLGRTIIGLLGTLIVIVIYLFARPNLGLYGAAFAAALTAVMPTLVVHSHYLKEDILMTVMCLLTLGFFSHYVSRRHWQDAWLVGIALGLACSSHYKSLLLLPVMCAFVLISDRRHLWRHGLMLTSSVAIGLAVFLLVNSVIFDDPQTFWQGFHHERLHSVRGHTVPIYWYHFGLCYHLLYSVIPGMTWPVAIVGVGSFAWYAMQYSSLATMEKLLILFGAVSYLVPELSPTKPAPDDSRYIIPFIPVLTYFGAKGLCDLSGRWIRLRRKPAVAVIGLIMVGWPLWDALQFDYYMTRDTRDAAQRYIQQNGLVAEYEPMAGTEIRKPWGFLVNVADLRARGYTHFVCSSLAYDQFYLGARLPNEPQYVLAYKEKYDHLFELPYVEFAPRHRQLGFTNPTVRIIELGGGH